MSRSVRTDYEALRENQARAQECLVIYPKHPDADAYRVGAAYEPYAIVATEKRFTGSELASEVWHSIVRFNSLLPSPEAAEEARRNAVIERFATNPSYDE